MLTVTADDFGIGFETSRGIVDAHLAGAVDAASVMTVTGDHLGRSLPLLDHAPKLLLGLHLTLTSHVGLPLVATYASGLVARDGHFRSLPDLLVRARCGRVSLRGVTDEILAQHDRFCRVLGRTPDHLDGHHHIHQAPVIRDAVADLIRTGQLPRRVRCTSAPPSSGSISLTLGSFRRRLVHRLGSESRSLFLRSGAEIDRVFCGMLSPDALALPNPWLDELQTVHALAPAADIELMTHPGHPDPSLPGRDSYLHQRVTELSALLAWGPIRSHPARRVPLPPRRPPALDPCAGEGTTVPP